MDQERNEGAVARPEGSEHFDDWCTEPSPWTGVYASFPWEQHRGLLPPIHTAAKEDTSLLEEDRGDGQPLGPPQQARHQ